jgi:hypothetical protein
MITTITLDNGETVSPNSAETYAALADILGTIDTLIQDQAELICPSLLRDDLLKIRHAVMDLRSDARHVADDVQRLVRAGREGDLMGAALEERKWRKNAGRRR